MDYGNYLGKDQDQYIDFHPTAKFYMYVKCQARGGPPPA